MTLFLLILLILAINKVPKRVDILGKKHNPPPKWVLWQIVKTQVTCSISSGSALYAWIKQPSGTEIHHNLDFSFTCDSLKYMKRQLIVSICIGTSSELILGFDEKGPTPPLCSQKGANLQIKWVMVFF